jgi:hypothetical protein
MKNQRPPPQVPLKFRVRVERAGAAEIDRVMIFEDCRAWTAEFGNGMLSLTLSDGRIKLFPAGQWTGAEVTTRQLKLR